MIVRIGVRALKYEAATNDGVSSSRRLESAYDRAISPLVGVLTLVALTVCLALVVAVSLGAVGTGVLSSTPAPHAAFDLAVDGSDEGELVIRHVSGKTIDVRELTVHVIVNDEALTEQPPVPFFSEDGFDGGPEGPFNERADPHWSVGQTASVSLARTNDPTIDPGDTVHVTLSVEGARVARLETEAN